MIPFHLRRSSESNQKHLSSLPVGDNKTDPSNAMVDSSYQKMLGEAGGPATRRSERLPHGVPFNKRKQKKLQLASVAVSKRYFQQLTIAPDALDVRGLVALVASSSSQRPRTKELPRERDKRGEARRVSCLLGSDASKRRRARDTEQWG